MTMRDREANSHPATIPDGNVIAFPGRRRAPVPTAALPPDPPPSQAIRQAMAVFAESDAALRNAAAGLACSSARLTDQLHHLDRQAARAARIRDEAARIHAAIEAGALDVMLALADELRGRGDVGAARHAP